MKMNLKTMVSVASMLMSAQAYNDWYFGGRDGNFFTYKCPKGAKIEYFEGRYGEAIDHIYVNCTGGTRSWMIGGDGGDDYFSLPNTDGIYKIGVRSDDKIRAIGYNGQLAGSGDGGEIVVAGGTGDCPLRALYGREDDIVYALGLVFQCDEGNVLIPDEMIGGSGGDLHQFLCPRGSTISRVVVMSDDDGISRIKYECNDGESTKSQDYGGSSGSEGAIIGFTDPQSNRSTLTQFTISGGESLDYIGGTSSSFGVNKGSDIRNHAGKNDDGSPDSCPAVGAWTRSDNDRVYAVGFVFDCDYANSGSV